MASSDGYAAAARSLRDGAGSSTSATSCIMVQETVPHWDVAEHRQLYKNIRPAKLFGAMFSYRQSSTMCDPLWVRCKTDIGAWNRK